jgi:hypothetical protein
MPQHVELVEQHMGLRGVTLGRIAKRPPHVHHCEADAGGLAASRRSHPPADLIATLRDLREAKGLPLDIPTGFVPFTKDAA